MTAGGAVAEGAATPGAVGLPDAPWPAGRGAEPTLGDGLPVDLSVGPVEVGGDGARTGGAAASGLPDAGPWIGPATAAAVVESVVDGDRRELDAALLAAHAAGDGRALVRLYVRAAQTDAAARAFYLTHAMVFALEAGDPAADPIRAELQALGAEPGGPGAGICAM